jgi:hypothetical protein
MDVFDSAIARHISEQAAGFMRAVFSLNDPRVLQRLLTDAGFSSVTARVHAREIRLPPAREFIWQYIAATPLITVIPQLGSDQKEAFEQDVVAGWERWSSDGDGPRYQQSSVFSVARR